MFVNRASERKKERMEKRHNKTRAPTQARKKKTNVAAPPATTTNKQDVQIKAADDVTRKRPRPVSSTIQLPTSSDVDDDEIAALERKLGVHKKGGKKKINMALVADGFADDEDDDFLKVLEGGNNNSPRIAMSSEHDNTTWEDEEEEKNDNDLSSPSTVFMPSQNLYGVTTSTTTPHMRTSILFDNSPTTSSEQSPIHLEIKRILNRVSEESVLDRTSDVQTVMTRGGHVREVCDAFVSTTLDLCSSGTTSGGTVLSATLIAMAATLDIRTSQSGNIGSRLVEHALRQVFESNKHYGSTTIMLVAHACMFEITGMDLLFDVCERLLGEQHVDYVWAVMCEVGGRMRKHSQHRFQLLKTAITGEDIANNLNSKIMAADERNLKLLKWLKRERAQARSTFPPLIVSLDDFLQAETKGRWWILGSAWQPHQHESEHHTSTTTTPLTTRPTSSASTSLLKAAKAQGMNTDIRRALFCALMGSKDYLDAFDAITRLNLTKIQQRDAVRVLLHCCGHSSKYNPFFALVTARLCTHLGDGFTFTLKLAIWDEFKTLDEHTNNIDNLARFTSELVLSEILAMAALLKPMSFVRCTRGELAFLKTFLFETLITTNHTEDVIVKAFRRRMDKIVRDGILVFLSRTEPFMSATKGSMLKSRLRRVIEGMEEDASAEQEKEETTAT